MNDDEHRVSECLALLVPTPGLLADHELLMRISALLREPGSADTLRACTDAAAIPRCLTGLGQAGRPTFPCAAGASVEHPNFRLLCHDRELAQLLGEMAQLLGEMALHHLGVVLAGRAAPRNSTMRPTVDHWIAPRPTPRFGDAGGGSGTALIAP